MATKIHFGGYQGENSVHTRAGRLFCTKLTEILGDQVDVQFEENIVEKGHKASDLLARTESGALDGCYFSSSYLAKRVPELGLFDQHFMVPSRHQAYAVLDGTLGARLACEIEAKTGYAVLGYWDNGLRHISTGSHAIHEPADCAGLKIRTLANDDHQRVFKSLGFTPMAIDVRDLPAAVAEGKVDAQENPLTNIYNFGLYKTHRNITLTGHLLGVALILFNKKTVKGWPEHIRKAVHTAMDQATKIQRKLAQADDEICARALQDAGVNLITLSDKQRKAFAAVTRPEVDITRSTFSAELVALFDQDLAQTKRKGTL